MKLLTFLIGLSVTSLAGNSYSQQTKFNMHLENTTVRQVFQEIEDNSEFILLYSEKFVDVNRKINIKVQNEPVNSILDQVFKGTTNFYEIHDRQIAIMTKAESGVPGVLSSSASFMQQKQVSGRVTDAAGSPLPGVSVIVKGTTSGTITDSNGNFAMNIPANTSTLLFSFVGMKSQEVQITGKNSVQVVLDEETFGLEEVVAIGYGTMKKSDLTGSVTSITSESFKNQPIINMSDILQARAPGISVTSNSGSPGKSTKIRIRGANSISGGNEPLYVVDGIIGGVVNANDVESVEILKDASATAIYGSRGANGVILITTRRGISGKPQIRLSSQTGINTMTERYDLLNPSEYAGFINDKFGQEVFSSSEIEKFKTEGGTDWQDAILQTGISQNYLASVSGGNENMNYYVSGNYINETGVIIRTSREKYSFRSNLNTKFSKRLSMKFNINAVKNDVTNGGVSTGGSKSDPMFQTLIWSPTEDNYNADGTYNRTDSYGSLLENPYMIANESNDRSMSQSFDLNTNMKYDIISGLTFDLYAGVKKTSVEGALYENEFIDYTPQARRSYTDYLDWQLTALLTYTKTLREKHNLAIVGGYELSASKSNGFSVTAIDLAVPSVEYYNLGLGKTINAGSSYSESSLLSYFVRFNYNFSQKYFLTGTYRADGSSKFRDDNKFGYFPSFALSWRLSEEPFIKDLGIFDNLKIRGSWGVTGNQAIGAYATLTQLQSFSHTFGSKTTYPGYIPGLPADINLKWEETKQKDLGLDVALMNNRLSFSLDVFKKNTTDLLTKKGVPRYSGFGRSASITQNLGEIENKGFELSMNYTAIQSERLVWDLSANFSAVRNKVINIGEQDKIFGTGYATGLLNNSPFVVMPGEPLGSFWGYKFLGIWGSDEAAEAAKFGNKPGDSKYQNLNDDHAIGAEDLQVIGDANPDFAWGLNSYLKFRNLELNVLIQGVHGQEIYNLGYGVAGSIIGDSRSIVLREAVEDRWTPQNENTIWPDYKSTTNVNYMNSSKYIQNGSYVKVRNISLSYLISKDVVKIGDLKLSISGQNLLTFTKYIGYDPEVSASGNLDTDAGIDVGTYPVPKTITLGVALDF